MRKDGLSRDWNPHQSVELHRRAGPLKDDLSTELYGRPRLLHFYMKTYILRIVRKDSVLRDSERKKISIQQDLNPWPLDYEAFAQPMRRNNHSKSKNWNGTQTRAEDFGYFLTSRWAAGSRSRGWRSWQRWWRRPRRRSGCTRSTGWGTRRPWLWSKWNKKVV